jgi:DeoR/GlpR family transcriptional regulator of sugar metabolism/DNA-binding LacI/PurR family transcriptional regulator
VIPSQREAVILDMLRQHGVISVDEIAVFCGCSAMSVRRDLHRLEQKHIVKRTHGGATLVETAPVAGRVNGHGLLQARNTLIDLSDGLIVTPSGSPSVSILVERARRAGAPIIAESINYQGALTYVAIDDYRAGVDLGRWTGSYLLNHRNGQAGPVEVLDVSSPLPNCVLRSRGFADGLRGILSDQCTIYRVVGGEVRNCAREVLINALTLHPNVSVVFGINDDMALATLDAGQALGRDLAAGRLILVTIGLEGDASKELLAQSSPLKASVAMFPELVGRTCIDAATCAYHGCPLPDRITMPHVIVTPENLGEYYEQQPSGGWSLRPGAVERLIASSSTLAVLSPCERRPRPERLGFIEVLSSHAWYQNVRRAMSERARSLGIRLEVIDASQDLDREIDELLHRIGQAAAAFVAESDIIILDTGKATAALAAALAGRTGITVVTNSLDVLSALAGEPGIRLIGSGGSVRGADRALVGHGAEASFGDIRAAKAFMTCPGGLSIDFGLSGVSTSESGVKQAMMHAAREVIVLADHTRLGTESLVKVAPIEWVHRVITDAGISEHDRLALTQRGIEVTIAET